MKINVILFRFPQANLFLAKIIVLDFTGVCFNAIMRPDHATSEKAATSAQKIRVLGWKSTVLPETIGPFATILPRSNRGFDLEFHLSKTPSNRNENPGLA